MSGSGSSRSGGSGSERDQDAWKKAQRAADIAEALEKKLPENEDNDK